MTHAPPTVLIMARAPRRGEVRRALEPLLGPDGCAALQSTLITQTASWATAISPQRVHVAHDPPDAGRELRELVGPDTAVFPRTARGSRAGSLMRPRGSSRAQTAHC